MCIFAWQKKHKSGKDNVNANMKKFLLMMAVAMMTALSAQAQKIKVVDGDNNAVSYASVLSPTGEYIGITNLDGELADLKGAKTVTVTHVAFKSKEVKVGGTDQVITLEDADFDLGEISVAPKPLVYVQTYYRMYLCARGFCDVGENCQLRRTGRR
jgi:hypothetical protein